MKRQFGSVQVIHSPLSDGKILPLKSDLTGSPYEKLEGAIITGHNILP